MWGGGSLAPFVWLGLFMAARGQRGNPATASPTHRVAHSTSLHPHPRLLRWGTLKGLLASQQCAHLHPLGDLCHLAVQRLLVVRLLGLVRRRLLLGCSRMQPGGSSRGAQLQRPALGQGEQACMQKDCHALRCQPPHLPPWPGSSCRGPPCSSRPPASLPACPPAAPPSCTTGQARRRLYDCGPATRCWCGCVQPGTGLLEGARAGRAPHPVRPEGEASRCRMRSSRYATSSSCGCLASAWMRRSCTRARQRPPLRPSAASPPPHSRTSTPWLDLIKPTTSSAMMRRAASEVATPCGAAAAAGGLPGGGRQGRGGRGVSARRPRSP